MKGYEMVKANLFWIKSVKEEMLAEEFRALKVSEDLPSMNKDNYPNPFLDGNTGFIIIVNMVSMVELVGGQATCLAGASTNYKSKVFALPLRQKPLQREQCFV